MAVDARMIKPRRDASDADYQRVKGQTAARLKLSLRRYIRELRVSGPEGEARAQTAFVQRQSKLLRDGYLAGRSEGLRDYWQAVSLKGRPPRSGVALSARDEAQLRQRLAFYVPSVVKMAQEIRLAWHADQRRAAHQHETPLRQFADPPGGGQVNQAVNPSEIDALYAAMDWRVQLQAEVSWVGLQSGYAAAGASDPAGVYNVIYWDLEPVKTGHCDDCVALADGSPYTIDTLNQTPGDGRTECGASCHCDLRYGSSMAAVTGAAGEANPASVAARLPSDYPIAGQAAGFATQPVPRPPGAAGDGELSAPQKGALDDLRAAIGDWDAVRGDLPPLDTLLAPESDAEAAQWAGISVEQLTSAQRRALDAYVDALGAWAGTFDEAALEDDLFGDEPFDFE